MKDYAAGIDLGGTRIKIAAVAPDGQLLHSGTWPTGNDSATDWARSIREALRDIEQQLEAPANAIGFAAPGLASRDNRSIWWMEGRLNSLAGADWETLLAPCPPVRVLNDAHAAMLAEAQLGSARNIRNAVLLTLGTGVGGAILYDGKLLQGTIGRAGHLGHMSLDPDGPRDIVNTPGSLELKVGNYSVQERSAGRFRSTEQMVEAAGSGDDEASRLWTESLRCLASAITSVINIIDPELVIIGGGISNAAHSLFEPLEAMLAEVEWRPHGHRVPVVRAHFQEWSGAIGAACFARQSLEGENR